SWGMPSRRNVAHRDSLGLFVLLPVEFARQRRAAPGLPQVVRRHQVKARIMIVSDQMLLDRQRDEGVFSPLRNGRGPRMKPAKLRVKLLFDDLQLDREIDR